MHCFVQARRASIISINNQPIPSQVRQLQRSESFSPGFARNKYNIADCCISNNGSTIVTQTSQENLLDVGGGHHKRSGSVRSSHSNNLLQVGYMYIKPVLYTCNVLYCNV